MSNGKILVTGGAGFIGSHVVDQLVRAGRSVVVFDNFSTGSRDNLQTAAQSNLMELIEGDIRDPAAVSSAMTNCSDVLHLACLGVRHSLTNPVESHEVNATGALILLEAALQARISSFLYCSSSEVYGTGETVPMDESHPTRPHTAYGASKLAGESYARAYGVTYKLPVAIVRPFNTFGPRSHHEGPQGEFIPRSIVRMLNNNKVTVFGDGSITRDFLYVEDTARALIKISQSPNCLGETINIGSSREYSLLEIIRLLGPICGVENPVIDFQAARPGDVERLFAGCTRAHELGLLSELIPLSAGLTNTVQYFRTHQRGISALLNEEGGRTWETSPRFR